ncbi:MAG: arylsulfotransferase family protein, partial [Pseudomonadota bacterium]
DGALVFGFDGGRSIQRIDSCGTRQWSAFGPFHHALEIDEADGALWTMEAAGTGSDFVALSAETGAVLSRLGTQDIINARPEIDLLKIRMEHDNLRNTNRRVTFGRWLTRHENFHFNDVDPLPPRLAGRFPMFEAGDLLISARELNLVFVVDRETGETKWWRVGAWNRQHDPDWLEDGRIGVYDNRMSRDYSQILAIDPATYETEVLVDGRAMDFYSRIRGKMQVLADGRVAVSSPQQGRVFETGPAGGVVLDIVNPHPARDGYVLPISEIQVFDEDHFDFATWACPPAP